MDSNLSQQTAAKNMDSDLAMQLSVFESVRKYFFLPLKN